MKRTWLLIPALLAPIAYAAVSHGTGGPVTLAAGADSVVVPFELRNNHVFVRGTLGDSDSLWFIVDSGAGSHCLNASAAKKLGLPVQGGVNALGANGSVASGSTRDVRYRLPGLTVEAPWVAVIDLDGIALQLGHPVDGILGFPLFDRSVLTVDYDRSQLVVHDAARFTPAGAALPLTFRENHPYLEGAIVLPGRKPAEGTFVLDTGSALALLLEPAFVEKSDAIAAVPKTVQARLGGVGGQSFHPIGRIDGLEIGPYRLARPVAVLTRPGPGRSSVPGSIGNIGGDVLQRFRVTFDYGRKRLHLVPGAAFARPFEWDMTGMTLVVQPDRSVKVMAVEPGSPAQEAGLRTDDVVESVNGEPLVPAELAALRKRLKTEGQDFRLGVLRGSSRTEVAFVTRRLI